MGRETTPIIEAGLVGATMAAVRKPDRNYQSNEKEIIRLHEANQGRWWSAVIYPPSLSPYRELWEFSRPHPITGRLLHGRHQEFHRSHLLVIPMSGSVRTQIHHLLVCAK